MGQGLIVVLIVLALAWNTLAVIVTEHLWYADLGYLGVFWKRAEARVIVCIAAFAVTFAFVAINLLATKAVSRLVSTRSALVVATVAGFWPQWHPTARGWSSAVHSRHVFWEARSDLRSRHQLYVFRLPIIRQIYAGSRWVVGLTAIYHADLPCVGALVRFARGS